MSNGHQCYWRTNFFKVKVVKTFSIFNDLRRSSMTQERLNSLAIMTTENDILQKTEFKDILLEFTAKKLRRVYT